MKKSTILLRSCISLISLLCLICGTAQAKTIYGNCPQLSEVFTTWETVATSYSAGGGWKVPKYAFSGGATDGIATAKKYQGCSAEISTSANKNKNRIHCIFALTNSEPTSSIHVFKNKPENYNCSCTSSTGRYSCVVK